MSLKTNDSGICHLKLLLGSRSLNVVKESHDLEKSEHTESGHVLAGAEWLESHEGNLHAADQPNYVERTVRCGE